MIWYCSADSSRDRAWNFCSFRDTSKKSLRVKVWIMLVTMWLYRSLLWGRISGSSLWEMAASIRSRMA